MESYAAMINLYGKTELVNQKTEEAIIKMYDNDCNDPAKAYNDLKNSITKLIISRLLQENNFTN